MQNTKINLESIPDLPSSTIKREDALDISTIKKFFVGIIVLLIIVIGGVLTAVFLLTDASTNSMKSDASITTITTSVTATTLTISATTTTITTVTTETTTTTTVTSTRRIFALNQVINGQTVTCSSVINTNTLYTECNDLQQNELYAPNGITCTAGWSTVQSFHWNTIPFCQSFLSSNNTYIEAYYDCGVTQTRFTWSNGVWGTTNDNGYTKHLRCYY